MAIIMVDCDDCYARADRLEEMARRCGEYAERLGDDCPELRMRLEEYGALFGSLTEDIRRSTDVWADFYRRNVRLKGGQSF